VIRSRKDYSNIFTLGKKKRKTSAYDQALIAYYSYGELQQKHPAQLALDSILEAYKYPHSNHNKLVTMPKCPDCGLELTKPTKSWFYSMFRVDSYHCICGAKFRQYININVIVPATSKRGTKLEKRIFTVKLQKGRWTKVD
jgi:hypothetical protein